MIFRFVLNSEQYGSFILPNEPVGWKDIELMLKRSLEYHGVFYEAMAPIEFKCGSGKEYIDKAFDELGPDAIVSLTISVSCSTGSQSGDSTDYSIDYSDDYGSMVSGSAAPVFENIFEGVLEFKNYSKTSESTSVSLIQSDFISNVLNRFDTKVEVTRNESLDGVALNPIVDFPSAITLHSKEILLETTFQYFNDTEFLFTVFPADGINIELPLLVEKDDIGGAIGTEQSYMWSVLSGGDAKGYENTGPIYENTTGSDITFTIDYNIVGNLQVRNTLSSTPVNFYFLLQVGGTQFSYSPFPTTLQNINGLTLDPNETENVSINAVGSLSATIQNGHKVFLCFYFTDIAGNVTNPGKFEFIGFTPTNFELSFVQRSTTDPSSASIFKIHELGAAIAQRITSKNDCFRSELLGRKNSAPVSYTGNGCGSFLGSLNGKHIRGFAISDAPYFCSMKDFYSTINACYNVGLGFEKIGGEYLISIEKKQSFYSQDVILRFDFVSDIKTSIAKEYYISDVYTGYDKWETSNVNGLDEFNTKREYNTGIKSIESRLNIVSPMVASMYSIELTRRKGVSTVDTEYDDDNFIICLARGVDSAGNPNQLNIAEKNENFSQATGFKSPETAYNIRRSPARNLLNHMNVIASSLIKYAGRAIKFVYGDGNFFVSTKYTNDSCPDNFQNNPLTENQDVTVAQADVTPIWIPEYIDFRYPLTFSQYLMLKNNPKGCIEVSETDTDFMKGFIVDIRYKPVGGIAEFKLLKAYVD